MQNMKKNAGSFFLRTGMTKYTYIYIYKCMYAVVKYKVRKKVYMSNILRMYYSVYIYIHVRALGYNTETQSEPNRTEIKTTGSFFDAGSVDGAPDGTPPRGRK